ncbi:MAG: protease complex subunit PrcB family protein [Chitinispirillia bacterium]|nr:protease complex subunit PrcB family protein [Chitinispirillia bacterium]
MRLYGGMCDEWKIIVVRRRLIMPVRQKKNILLCILTVLPVFTVITSCDMSDTYPITIKPVLIEEGQYVCRGGTGNFVIKTQAEFDSLICLYSTGKNINFGTHQVIAVIDIARPSGGWSINITSIKEYSDDIVVSIYIKAPKGPATDGFTRPYQIVKIPVTEKDVVFKYINSIPNIPL